jgi:dolichyl-phosphate-mannose--protein O-mannosyl transferase
VSATVGTLIGSLLVVPLGVYLISYGSFFYQHGPAIHDFLTLQLRMLRYQQQHIRVQPENSRPWTWPIMLHPIQYYREAAGGTVHEIVAIGNPALWWGFLALIPVGLVTMARRTTWRETVAVGGVLAMYVPWLVVPRSQFIFYMLPAVPFMCLTVVAILRTLPANGGRIVAGSLLIAAVAGAVAFAPVWTGSAVSDDWVDRLRWLPDWPV